MLGGLIAGALKGAAEGYSTYAKGELENKQKLDYATKILEMQTEKDLRVDEIKRQRDLDYIPKTTGAQASADAAAAPVRAQGQASAARVLAESKLKDDTELDARRAEQERAAFEKRSPLRDMQRSEKNKDVSSELEARGKAERANQGAYAGDAKAREGVRAKARDQHIESAASAAQAALANFELTQRRAVADLRTKLSKLPKDSPEREAVQQQLQDLQLGASMKSYADVVTAGDAYRKMAENIRRDADKYAENEEERKRLLARASQYEAQADAILSSAVGRRLSGAPGAGAASGGRPSAGSAPAAGAPWTRNWGGQPGNISNNPAP